MKSSEKWCFLPWTRHRTWLEVEHSPHLSFAFGHLVKAKRTAKGNHDKYIHRDMVTSVFVCVCARASDAGHEGGSGERDRDVAGSTGGHGAAAV